MDKICWQPIDGAITTWSADKPYVYILRFAEFGDMQLRSRRETNAAHRLEFILDDISVMDNNIVTRSMSAASTTGQETYRESRRGKRKAVSNANETPKRKKRIRVRCKIANCPHHSRRDGVCFLHGGKLLCSVKGCTKCAHRGKLCIAHGGGRRCGVENCPKSAQAGGNCYIHGGGQRCALEDCNNAAKKSGHCTKHFKMLSARGQLPKPKPK